MTNTTKSNKPLSYDNLGVSVDNRSHSLGLKGFHLKLGVTLQACSEGRIPLAYISLPCENPRAVKVHQEDDLYSIVINNNFILHSSFHSDFKEVSKIKRYLKNLMKKLKYEWDEVPY